MTWCQRALVRHALKADRESNFNLAGLDLVRDVRHGHEPRGAPTVDGLQGDGIRNASSQGGIASLVRRTCCEDSAYSDVSNGGRVDTRPRNGLLLAPSAD